MSVGFVGDHKPFENFGERRRSSYEENRVELVDRLRADALDGELTLHSRTLGQHNDCSGDFRVALRAPNCRAARSPTLDFARLSLLDTRGVTAERVEFGWRE